MIAARFDGGSGASARVVDDAAPVRRAQFLAGVGVAVLAVVLAVLPALVALGVAGGAVRSAAVGLASLAAIWGGVKWAAMVIGATRLAGRHVAVFAALDD